MLPPPLPPPPILPNGLWRSERPFGERWERERERFWRRWREDEEKEELSLCLFLPSPPTTFFFFSHFHFARRTHDKDEEEEEEEDEQEKFFFLYSWRKKKIIFAAVVCVCHCDSLWRALRPPPSWSMGPSSCFPNGVEDTKFRRIPTFFWDCEWTAATMRRKAWPLPWTTMTATTTKLAAAICGDNHPTHRLFCPPPPSPPPHQTSTFVETNDGAFPFFSFFFSKSLILDDKEEARVFEILGQPLKRAFANFGSLSLSFFF